MKNLYLKLIALILLPLGAISQPTVWQQVYPSSFDRSGRNMITTVDNGILVVGMTENSTPGDSNIYIMKIKIVDGDTLWTKKYGGSSPDYAYKIIPTSDGNYFVVGYTKSYGAGNYDSWLLKINGTGDTLWTKTYGGPGDDMAKDIIPTSDGNYMIAGRTNSMPGGTMYNYDSYLMKVDISGTVLWTKYYGGSLYETAHAVRQCSDGGYVFTGQTCSFGAGNGDIWLVRTNSSGDTTWTKHWGGPNIDDGNDMVINSDGGYTIAGETNSIGAGDYDVQMIRTDASGSTIWNRTWGGNAKDISHTVTKTSDGNYLVGCISRSFGWVNPDMWILKIEPVLGDTLWTAHYGAADHEHCYGVLELADNSIVALGHTKSYGPNMKIMIVRLNKNGGPGPLSVNEELAAKNILISPNPSNGQLRVSWNEQQPMSLVKVVNVLGQVIYSEKTETGKTETLIDIGNAMKGIYYIVLSSENNVATMPVIIE